MTQLTRRTLARGYLLANEVGSAKDRQQFATLLIERVQLLRERADRMRRSSKLRRSAAPGL